MSDAKFYKRKYYEALAAFVMTAIAAVIALLVVSQSCHERLLRNHASTEGPRITANSTTNGMEATIQS